MCSRPYRPFGLPIYVARAPRLHSRSYPRRFTFYVADPISSIETRSLPTLARSYPRRFTFYVADPISSIPARSFALPSFQRSPIMHHKPLMMRAENKRKFKVSFGEAPKPARDGACAPPIPIASRPHCKHLPRMTPGFGAGLVIETQSLPSL